MHSKATLRSAVGRFVKDHSKADYYPSFIRHAFRPKFCLREDRVHLRSEAVDSIIKVFVIAIFHKILCFKSYYLKMITPYNNSIDTNEIFSLLSDFGFVHLKQQIIDELLTKLNNEFDLITSGNISSGCLPLELSIGTGVSFRFTSENKNFVPETFRFFKQSWMQEMSDKFWSNRITLNPSLYVMHELPGTQHIAQDLHFDVKKTLKFFISKRCNCD